jgi:hypothetical protein
LFMFVLCFVHVHFMFSSCSFHLFHLRFMFVSFMFSFIFLFMFRFIYFMFSLWFFDLRSCSVSCRFSIILLIKNICYFFKVRRDKHANSIVIACLKRLLPVGLNVFGGRELDIVQQSKERFLAKENDEKVREFIRGRLSLPVVCA